MPSIEPFGVEVSQIRIYTERRTASEICILRDREPVRDRRPYHLNRLCEEVNRLPETVNRLSEEAWVVEICGSRCREKIPFYHSQGWAEEIELVVIQISRSGCEINRGAFVHKSLSKTCVLANQTDA